MGSEMFVGLDVSKNSTMATAIDGAGQRLTQEKLGPSDAELIGFLRALPTGRQHVVLEACNVWEHIYDAVASTGADVVLAHPLETKYISRATLKTDRVDSAKLAELGRLNAVPQAYAPPPEIRALRRLCRERVFYLRKERSIAHHVYAVMLQKGVPYEEGVLQKKRRREQLRQFQVPEVDRGLDAIEKLEEITGPLDEQVRQVVRSSPEAQLLATVPGVGPVTALTLVAFLSPIERFDDLEAVVKYCGLCPSVRQSGEKSVHGPLVWDCQEILKWVMVEAQWITRRFEKGGDVAKVGKRVARRGKPQDGAVAAARKLVRICASILRRGTPYQPHAPGSPSRHHGAA
ncbi:MAG: IS110 family transposase [Thermoplasmata archaeon]